MQHFCNFQREKKSIFILKSLSQILFGESYHLQTESFKPYYQAIDKYIYYSNDQNAMTVALKINKSNKLNSF